MCVQFHGNLGNTCSIGTNKLIKNGANLITDINDILELFPQFLNRRRKTEKKKLNISELKSEYKNIYSCLNDEFLSIDQIAIESKKDVREVINKLTLMEIEGLVQFEFGKGYRRMER